MLLISAIGALFTALVAIAVAFRNQNNKHAKATKELTEKVIDMAIKFSETAGGLKSAIEGNTKATDRSAQATDELHRTILKATK